MDNWKPIESAPRNKRVLVVSDMGNIYAAQWAQNPFTDDIKYKIADLDNGESLLVNATHWQPLPEPPKDVNNGYK
jgi:hypothetical protein